MGFGARHAVGRLLARLAVVPLLDEQSLKKAETEAIASVAVILRDYFIHDNDYPDEPVTVERWTYRVTAMTRSAIAVYQKSLMEVKR